MKRVRGQFYKNFTKLYLFFQTELKQQILKKKIKETQNNNISKTFIIYKIKKKYYQLFLLNIYKCCLSFLGIFLYQKQQHN
jgi:regulator of PEP synthase PpsR (kinase-PPPase family)